MEVQAARLAARRRTDEDVAAMRQALAKRRAAAEGGGEEFLAADIALHAGVVASAHNPVLTDLFAEFVPVLRRGLTDLLSLTDVVAAERDHGDAAHTALVDAVAAGDEEAAERVLRAELARTLDRLRGPVDPVDPVDPYGTGLVDPADSVDPVDPHGTGPGRDLPRSPGRDLPGRAGSDRP
jgi:DNA-binding FadR family transcriptional regulator